GALWLLPVVPQTPRLLVEAVENFDSIDAPLCGLEVTDPVVLDLVILRQHLHDFLIAGVYFLLFVLDRWHERNHVGAALLIIFGHVDLPDHRRRRDGQASAHQGPWRL